MHYERPAIERRMPVSLPVIEGALPPGTPLLETPVWNRPSTGDSESSAPNA